MELNVDKTRMIADQLVADGYNIFNPNVQPVLPNRWQRLAACVDADPDIFFPEMGCGYKVHDKIIEARHICDSCPVQSECLATSIMHRERSGVWGGTTYPERKIVWSRYKTWRMADNDDVHWPYRATAV